MPIFYATLYILLGLYPQLAIADEFNNSKGGLDQLFHTRVKPFNVLHPNSIFASNPEYLAIEDFDTVHMPGFSEKYPASTKHQILVYMSLLETTKPFVVNATRMPALQTLLLFSHDIDTNCNFSRLVFDSWIEIHFADAEEGQNQILKAAILRNTWLELLNLRLRDSLKPKDVLNTSDTNFEKSEVLENKLSRGLIEFMHTETILSIRRLLPGDLKVMYSKYVDEGRSVSSDENPFQFNKHFTIKENESKGGLYLTDYLTYNCLENSIEENSCFCIQWQCPICEEAMYASSLQRIFHYRKCCENLENQILTNNQEQLELKKQKENPNAREYRCPHETCKGKTYYFTSVQLLRHKNSHKMT